MKRENDGGKNACFRGFFRICRTGEGGPRVRKPARQPETDRASREAGRPPKTTGPQSEGAAVLEWNGIRKKTYAEKREA